MAASTVADDLKPEGTAYSRTLKRAADLSGGLEQLARLLHVRPADLATWITGAARPPQDIFLAALDIVSGARSKRKPEGTE